MHALTGVDTDRLPQEKARGMSIELGFAPLVLASGRHVSVIDVPGHERFVRTMVAGATGIDFYLMVIAADDGVMPQTLEHAEVLAALGIEQGVVAITKSDRAAPEMAAAEAAELLPTAEIVACSARTGDGVADVAAALERVAQRVQPRGEGRRAGAAVLHIDRVFTIHGAGTVVTGTLWSGTIAVGDTLHLLPAQRPVRVRSLQVHDEPAEQARSGQRVAVNLAAIARRDVARGDALAAPAAGIVPAHVIDAALDLRDDLHGRRVHGASRHARGGGAPGRARRRPVAGAPRGPAARRRPATGSSCARSPRPTRSPAARCSIRGLAGTVAAPTSWPAWSESGVASPSPRPRPRQRRPVRRQIRRPRRGRRSSPPRSSSQRGCSRPAMSRSRARSWAPTPPICRG